MAIKVGDNENQNKPENGVIKRIVGTAFVLMLLVSMGYLIAGLMILPNDRGVASSDAEELSNAFEVLHDGGDTEMVTIPSTYEDAEESGTLTLVTKVAADPGQDWLMIWNMGHELEVYVGSELRFSIHSDERRLLKGEVAYQYDFINLRESDNGKELRICFVNYANENDNLGNIYLGDKAALLLTAVKDSQMALLLAVTVMFFGFVACIIASIKSKEFPNMDRVFYLGLGVFVASAWFLFNSPATQFVFPNVEVARDCAFFFASMISLPFLVYFEKLLGGRYRRVIASLKIASIVGFITLITGYFILGLDINDAFYPTIIVALLSLGTVFAIIMGDVTNRKIREYYLAAMGTVFFVIFALIYVLMYLLFPFKGDSGILLMLGITILFVCGVLSAAKDK
ncbi:MAG: hypothetical protein K6E63_05390 [Lachnospiraceae bacterium]|nr:hypothetical protein [Lachnospiraceae bacterium]